MQISVKIVDELLRRCIAKADKSITRIDLIELSEIVNAASTEGGEVGRRYLYDTIYLGIEKAKRTGEDYIRVHDHALNTLARYLGFASLEAFVRKYQPTVPALAQTIAGNWYSIVRCNSGKPRVLVSPVQIVVGNDGATLVLRGYTRSYRGEVRWTAGCFSTLLTSDDGLRTIHLVFRLGVVKGPRVISGLFSSVSSSGAPIAGLELLLRSDDDFSKMVNVRIPLEGNEQEHASLISDEILHYFSDFDRCYFKVNDQRAFEFRD